MAQPAISSLYQFPFFRKAHLPFLLFLLIAWYAPAISFGEPYPVSKNSSGPSSIPSPVLERKQILDQTFSLRPQLHFVSGPTESKGWPTQYFENPSTRPTDPTPLKPSPLEDILLEEGVLSSEQWLRIKAAEEQRLNEQSEAIDFNESPRWYERLRMYGFGELRYNRLGNPNGNLISWQDPSVGKYLGEKPQFDPAEPRGFLLRRVRLALAGQVSDRVSMYLQADFNGESNDQLGSVSLRDAWGQFAFDSKKEWRLRVGQQRVPCSFDSWQSSRQRVAIDRSDATASCMPGQRDAAISLLYTPQIAQYRWKQMVDYLEGAGDYGMINLSVMNGQGANQLERNDNKTFALRLAYPFELWGGRLLEIGGNAMTGKYSVDPGEPSNTSLELFSLNENKTFGRKNYDDKRVNAYLYYPPQPYGLLTEWVWGKGPRRDHQGIIRERNFSGGYVQLQYQWKYSDTGYADFYGRWSKYNGGLKFATGAPNVRSEVWEFGIAWMPDPQWEVTVAYEFAQRKNFQRMKDLATFSNATPCDSSFNIIDGNTPPTTNAFCEPGKQINAHADLVRIQLQWYFN